MEMMDLGTSSSEFYTSNNDNINNLNLEEEEEEGERCGICMDIIIDMGLLDCCKHMFCFVCIDNWSTITNLCPLCQSEFQLITCVPVYDTTGSHKVDDDEIPRDEEWSIEGKSSTLSFPSYYIDENAVVCLDGDGCKIRHGSASIEESQSLDTSIACDSCDVWYHAFCVGFDTDDTSEDTWLCPRCANNDVPQQHDENSLQKTNSHSIPEDAHSNCLAETAFSKKVSVSVADDGETAVVVSMVDGYPPAPNSSQDFLSTLEIDNDVKPDSNSLKEKTTPNCAQSSSNEHELKLSSLSHDVNVSGNSESCSTNKLSDGETGTGLHPGLSTESSLSVDVMKNDESEDQLTGDLPLMKPLEVSLCEADKIVPDANENAGRVLGHKRKLGDISEDAYMTSEDKKTKVKNVPGVLAKKTGSNVKIVTTLSNETQTSSSQILLPSKNKKFKRRLEKKDETPDIMSIVKGNGLRPSERKECENSSGVRIKKIMRAAENKDSSMVVEELRKKIREAVRNKEEIGENLFDPKLLAAFRVAIAGPKTEPVKKLSESALKVKRSMFQKGKVRENLTKKIYADSNGRRKRAWARDCNVEFWKYQCMRATKPEKIQTLESVLDLLKKNPDIDKASESHTTNNPILSRLYLADNSVFPRKDNIKPLSALGGSEQKSKNDNDIKISVSNKLLSTPSISMPDKNSKTNVSSSKADAISTKAPTNKRPGGSGDSKCVSQKIDKRKWALEILARKNALEVKTVTHDKEEDNAKLKGNYPLLAQLPADMRPALAPSRHNKVPISVRQTQLYRITEHFLKKANLSVLRRTAETELAVADAVNIEKIVADKSNSKAVYLNLCSQELLHYHSDDKNSNKAENSNSSPVHVEENPEDATDNLCSDDPDVLEALRKTGLLGDSPPNSPSHNKTDVSGDSLKTNNEQDPDNIFEMDDSHPEVDIYGDFEYDIEDEDFIGLKVTNPQPESVSKVKVLFSTINSEKLINGLDTVMKDDNSSKSEIETLESENEKLNTVFDTVNGTASLKSQIEKSTLESENEKSNTVLDTVIKDDTSSLKSQIETSTVDSVSENSCLPLDLLNGEEAEELSMMECEELYGPDKEPLITRFPQGASSHGLASGEKNPSTRKILDDEKNPANTCQSSDKSSENEKKSNAVASKHSDGTKLVSKKVEAYIKEHIRPLCLSGVITREEYRWAVAKTTEKVMKYHSNAKSASFLIKEGDKVKKLAEQYIETAQKKEQCDP
ncbi:hypothetical protein ACFE04_015738 [Oxalis oulophora]